MSDLMSDDAMRQFTPLEMFKELQGEASAMQSDITGLKSDMSSLRGDFGRFALETNEKFSLINKAQNEIRSSQAQTHELLVELKNRDQGLDTKGLVGMGSELLKATVSLATLFALVVGGILWLSAQMAAQGDNKVVSAIKDTRHELNDTSKDRHTEQEAEIVSLQKDKEVILGLVSRHRIEIDELTKQLRDVRESRNTTEDGQERDRKIAALEAKIIALEASSRDTRP